jgi:putative transposase
VDRRFVLGDEEREKFRTFMRMQENFSGCRVLSYCVMSNHFHILLEVPVMPEGGISDRELLKRLGAVYGEAFVAGVEAELAGARKDGDDALVSEIHARFTYRMHSLSEFMKTLLQRFTRWFNRTHERCGTLWEQRYKSVIVESGIAARTMAAYIDLNPVRAGMVKDPAEYRWSSYGEAVGGGRKGNGKKARAGLVRAANLKLETLNPKEEEDLAGQWNEVSRTYRRVMGMALERKSSNSKVQLSRKSGAAAGMNDAEYLEAAGGVANQRSPLQELLMAKMLRTRVRYFTDGAVIGSKGFVDDAFVAARSRFSGKRKDGARRLRGNGKAAAGTLWSMRDLRVGVT